MAQPSPILCFHDATDFHYEYCCLRQGCFGYRTGQKLLSIVDSYRKHKIPLDGLAVDVDIQQNFKTFTIDTDRFPNPKQMFADLRKRGVKCCTNITPIISLESTDGYTTYQEGFSKGFFVKDTRFEVQPKEKQRPAEYYDVGSLIQIPYDKWDKRSRDTCDSGEPYIGQVWYGGTKKTAGHYPDLAVKDVRIWWGKQYEYLFDQGLEFVWQDMTTPAIPVEKVEVPGQPTSFKPFGDMKGFPYRLMLTDDFLSGAATRQMYDAWSVLCSPLWSWSVLCSLLCWHSSTCCFGWPKEVQQASRVQDAQLGCLGLQFKLLGRVQ